MVIKKKSEIYGIICKNREILKKGKTGLIHCKLKYTNGLK